MQDITHLFKELSGLPILTEITPNGDQYEMYNTGGVEVEVAEFLYSLVRLWKPRVIIETGTHKGISAGYMGLGCKANDFGVVASYEVIPSLAKGAAKLWKKLGVADVVQCNLCSSLANPLIGLGGVAEEIDLLFLDSEPQYRFDEFVRFWPKVVEGGLIAIHDLHHKLGRSNLTYKGMEHWPYGDWEPKLGRYVRNFDVQMIHLPNPRGMVLMQKTRAADENIRLLRQM